MSRYVLDASVVVKWFAPEPHSDEARRLLIGDHDFVGPDILPIEVTNGLLRKLRRGEVDVATVQGASAVVPASIELAPSLQFLEAGLAIAMAYQRTAYDSIYVALALQQGCELITADEHLYNALRSDFSGTMLWVEDVPA